MVHAVRGVGAEHVWQVADGLAGMRVLNDVNANIDVVISDLDMPGMDGMEFMRHIGEAQLPVAVILVSGHERALLDSVATMAESYGIQLLGVLGKPVSIHDLSALVALYRPPGGGRHLAGGPEVSEQEIAEALAAGCFDTLFQPKVELASRRIVGAEALARWKHPTHGIIDPCSFISMMETGSYIDDLTWIMLRKAASACRAWRDQGLDVSVSVNISRASLTRVGLADRITSLVREQGLDPSNVILELTESAAMTHLARALENLARLRMRGFGLSIDDYGTGYSSMQQLARIPFTELKIDQSFVAYSIEKDSCRFMLESSVDIARKLGLKAVAEGVQSRGEWDLLRAIGCDVAQGYYVAPPMEAGALVRWVGEWMRADSRQWEH